MHQIELLAVRHHKANGMAICLKPKVPYIITPSLAHEIRLQQNKIAEEYYAKPWDGILYLLWYLHADSKPWNGLDFKFIYDCLVTHNEAVMEKYIEEIFDLLFLNYIGLGLPILTCSILNRKLSGISIDFFYLNRINFIKHNNSECETKETLHFNKVSFDTDIGKASFPDQIYLRNNFYKFKSIDFNTMRTIISSFQYEPISGADQHHIKLIFDALARETVERIYAVAAKNIHIIKRFSMIQAVGAK